MKRMGSSLTLIVFFISVVLISTFAAHKSGDTLAYNLQQPAADADMPLVEFVNADNPATIQKARKRRGSLRQDKSIAELPAGVEPLPLAAHLWARLPALPVAQSNAVVLGEITGRRAILTDDKLGIYSEFSIHLVRVFKDDQGVLRGGGSVEASRLGGAVRFPSGRIQEYTVFSQGYPKQGRLYVLFLKRDEEGDFSILTGYDLSSPGVTPLDGDPGDKLQFGIYRGVKQELFLGDLGKALQARNGTWEPNAHVT
jgi:hypothetical protein